MSLHTSASAHHVASCYNGQNIGRSGVLDNLERLAEISGVQAH